MGRVLRALERARAPRRGHWQFGATLRSLAKFEVLFHDQFVADFKSGRRPRDHRPHADNDLQIRSKFVSRHHAQIVSDRHQSVLEDLNSTNGVFINRKRVKRQELVDGDVIQLGEHKLLYRDMRHLRLATAEDYDADEDFEDDLDRDEEERDDEDFR